MQKTECLRQSKVMFVNVMDYGSQCVSVLWPEGLRGGVEMKGHGEPGEWDIIKN